MSDILNLDLSKINSESLQSAIKEMVEDYNGQVDKKLFEEVHAENIDKMMSMVEQFSPEAIVKKTKEKKTEGDKKSTSKSGRKPSEQPKQPSKKKTSGETIKVAVVLLGDLNGIKDKLEEFDLNEADMILFMELTEELEKAIEENDEERIKSIIQKVYHELETMFNKYDKANGQAPDGIKEALNEATDSVDKMLEELGIPKISDNGKRDKKHTEQQSPIELSDIILTPQLVKEVIEEVDRIEKEHELNDEDEMIIHTTVLDLEESLNESDHNNFRKHIERAVDDFKEFVIDISNVKSRKGTVKAMNKLISALGGALLSVDGTKESETEKQRQKRIKEELVKLAPQLKHCRDIVNEANRQKRNTTAPKPKPTRLTRLKKKVLSFTQLMPPDIKKNPAKVKKTKNDLMKMFVATVENWEMDKVRGKAAATEIKETYEDLEDKAIPAPQEETKKQEKTEPGKEPKHTIKVDLLYRDASNYKTSYPLTIDLKDYPEAKKLKIGDQFEMGEYGSLRQKEFFNSEVHPYDYNDEDDHNILEVVEITK